MKTEKVILFSYRSLEVSELAACLMKCVKYCQRLMARWGRALAEERRARIDVDRLSALDDRLLKDIGISRSEIEYIVYQRSHKWAADIIQYSGLLVI